MPISGTRKTVKAELLDRTKECTRLALRLGMSREEWAELSDAMYDWVDEEREEITMVS